jgi:sortase A
VSKAEPKTESPASSGVRVSIDLPTLNGAALKRAGIKILIVIPVVVVLFAAFLFGASNLEEARSQHMLLNRFAAGLPTGTVDQLGAPIPLGSPVALIEIPTLNLRQVVVEGASPDDLKSGPGHLPVSSLPGEVGNVVILGRHAGFGGPFRGLGGMHVGDKIVVTTGQGAFAYDVTGVTPAPREQTSFFQPTADSTLTLVTSASISPWSDRIAVTAKLEGAALGIPYRPISVIGDSALGTGGDPLGYPLAFVWGVVLVGAIMGARRLYRRWTSLAAYLVSAPVILLLIWMTCENLARVLPGTL